MSDPQSPTSRKQISAGGLAATVLTLTLMLATEPRLAIVWDEGYTLGRVARLRWWFQGLGNPARFAAEWHPPAAELVQRSHNERLPRPDQVNTRSKLLFDPDVLAYFWPFAREEPHGHPPFYALVCLLGDLIAPSWPALERARLGPILLFSLVAGGLFAFAASRWGLWAGSLAAAAWTLQPQLFGLGHYAHYDGVLACLWVAAILAFGMAVEPGPVPKRWPRWGWVALFGILAGCAAGTKLTGWFLPLPMIVWTLIYRDRRAFLALLLGGLIAFITLYAMNPAWWLAPIGGLLKFFQSNLGRAQTIRISVMFLGKIYDTPAESLPWYNTLLWTLMASPVGFLVLALVGAGRSLRRFRTERFGVLVFGQWVFLLALRALPHVPGHDGVRQFLPAFGCLAVLAGLGAASAVQWKRTGKALIVAAVVEGAASVAVMMPVPLSYFSPLVRGLPGAARLGMEPTYYWDALSNEALDWLKTHTSDDQKVLFATNPTSFQYLHEIGRLPECRPFEPGKWTWFVLQNRPGAFSDEVRYVLEHGTPAFTVKKLGVPLVWIFPFQDYDAAQRTVAPKRNAF